MRVSLGSIACLLLLPTLACQADAEVESGPALPERSAPAGMDESLRDAALALVEEREQALVDGDRDAFLATVDPGAEAFATSQARWWDNVARLPATDFSLELGDEGVMTRISGDGDLQLPIDFTMRLDGYDEHPVTQPLIYTFVGDEDEVRLTNDRNLQSDAATGWVPAPWDVTTITVEESDGVLGVFDDETRAGSDDIQADIVAARDAIEPLLPPWSGRVVAYDISDTDAIDDMSTMTIEQTGGVAFPVLSRPDRRRVAAYRFAVNPTNLGGGLERDLLMRHELVHVALAGRDDWSPVWLAEGTAEYVARAATYSVAQRRFDYFSTLDGRPGLRLRMGTDFYQRGETWLNYELAGLVCDYLASTRGDDVLWGLMDTFRGRSFATFGEADDLLRSELGLSSGQLRDSALAWARSG
ncbi:hypothetical protein SAMN04489844_0096 [Nocardioides exalbidus]|uniref:Peptidase MA superfamily protein n=1 Tax=Nocardioides exalbidus TaxID=402596 RepID=A0A1H4JEF2_9ACTN|nr:hypothetical protein [Nocardioides exalbidus]SEB44487.1 hypothetical protein SAMN04489844_0096 [Nocardioides exalbidus]